MRKNLRSNGKSAGRAPSVRGIPWHLPYNWGKKHWKTSVRLVLIKEKHESPLRCANYLDIYYIYILINLSCRWFPPVLKGMTIACPSTLSPPPKYSHSIWSLSFTFLLQNPDCLSPPPPPPSPQLTLLFYFHLISRIFYREFTSLRSLLWIFLQFSSTSSSSNFLDSPILEHTQSCSSLNFADQCSRQYLKKKQAALWF